MIIGNLVIIWLLVIGDWLLFGYWLLVIGYFHPYWCHAYGGEGFITYMRKLRISLLTVVLALIAIGIVMIYSSTAIYAWEKFGDSAYF